MLKGKYNRLSNWLSAGVCTVILPFTTALADTALPRQPAALDRVGVYQLRDIAPELTGAGIRITAVSRSMTYADGQPMNDYRPLDEHLLFSGRTFIYNEKTDLPAGVSAHETAVASILFGQDPNLTLEGLGRFRYEGVTPEAAGDFHEFWHFLTHNVFPQKKPDADAVTISLGSQFDDWWTRGIEALSEKYGLPIVAGIGNGQSVHDSTLFPAAGSNVIGVGVVKEIQTTDLLASLSKFWLPEPAFSSCGPTDDNRAKPDIVAPGRCLAADATDASGIVITPSGSSYATPVVAGVIGLLTQAAKEDPNLSLAGGEGAGRVMRAILMTSARKLPYWHKGELGTHDDNAVPLDYSQGAGELDAAAAYRLLKAGRQEAGSVKDAGWDFTSLRLDGTDSKVYTIGSDTAGKTITATLIWNRHYQQKYPFARDHMRDADLRLELWAYNDAGSKLADYSDSRTDNVEHISFKADPNEQYLLLVRSNERTEGNDRSEGFAIAWNADASQIKDASWYDINGDGKVNLTDSLALIANIRSNGEGSRQIGDINGDGSIDLLDVVIISKAINNP